MRKRSKFNVDADTSKRTFDGIVFDSEMERKFYETVILPGAASGEIVEYELQKKYELQPKYKHDGKTVRAIDYRADFYYVLNTGEEIVVDVKGFADSTAKLKRKLFWYVYPDLTYKWVSYSGKYGGWIDYDELQRKRRSAKKKGVNGENGRD